LAPRGWRRWGGADFWVGSVGVEGVEGLALGSVQWGETGYRGSLKILGAGLRFPAALH